VRYVLFHLKLILIIENVLVNPKDKRLHSKLKENLLPLLGTLEQTGY